MLFEESTKFAELFAQFCVVENWKAVESLRSLNNCSQSRYKIMGRVIFASKKMN